MPAYHREENSGYYNKIIGTRSDGRFVVEHSSQDRDSVRTIRLENEHAFYVDSPRGWVVVSREEALREFRSCCASDAPTTEPQQDGKFIVARPHGEPSMVTYGSYSDAEQTARSLAIANTGKRFYVARLLSVAEVSCPAVQVTQL